MVYSLVQRWKKAHVVLNCLNNCNKGSLDYCLNSSHGSTISKHEFIRAIRKEYDIKDPRVETYLARFHDSFNCELPNCYEILCTLKTITHAELLVNDPRHMLNILFDVCSDENGRVHTDEVNLIINLGNEESQISNGLKQNADDFLARLKGRQMCIVDKTFFIELFDLHQALTNQFQTNVWSKIPESRRLQALIQIQNVLEARALDCCEKILVRKVVRTWRQLKEITFSAWVRYAKDMNNKRLVELRMKYWKTKTLIQKWSIVIEDLIKKREIGPKIDKFSSLNMKKRYFTSWRKATMFLHKFTIKSRKIREIALASSLVNELWFRMIARRKIISWRRDVELLNRQQRARRLSENICMRTHFIRWIEVVTHCKR